MTTPHPLAIEAGHEILMHQARNNGRLNQYHVEHIIHTTALQPVIEKGGGLTRYTRHSVICKANKLETREECSCGLSQALTQWRTLTKPQSEGTPKTATEPPRSL
jgi:hypothetical protein